MRTLIWLFMVASIAVAVGWQLDSTPPEAIEFPLISPPPMDRLSESQRTPQCVDPEPLLPSRVLCTPSPSDLQVVADDADGATRFGRVFDADTKVPIRGATLRWLNHVDAPERRSATSDESGDYRTDGITEKYLIVSAPGYSDREVVIDPTLATLRLDVAMTSMVTLDVIVTLRDQSGLRGAKTAQLALIDADGGAVGEEPFRRIALYSGPKLDRLTDRDGLHRLPLPPPGRYRVEACVDGVLPGRSCELLVEPDQSLQTVVEIEGRPSIRGRVVREREGTPVEGATIVLEKRSTPNVLRVDLRFGVETFGSGKVIAETKSRSDGTFEIRGELPDVDKVLRVAHEQVGGAIVDSLRTSLTQELTVALPAWGRVEGQVVGDRSGHEVIVIHGDLGRFEAGTVDSEGAFQVRVACGNYALEVGDDRAPKRARHFYGGDRMPKTPPIPRYDLAVGCGATVRHDVDVTTTSHSWVDAVVSNDDGPIEGASVRLVSRFDEVELGATTDAEGHVFLGRAPKGDYRVTVYVKDAGGAVVARGITLSQPSERLELSATCAELVLFALDRGSARVGLGRVDLRRRDVAGEWRRASQASLDRSGEARFGWLMPGDYRARVTAPDGRTGVGEVTVGGGVAELSVVIE